MTPEVEARIIAALRRKPDSVDLATFIGCAVEAQCPDCFMSDDIFADCLEFEAKALEEGQHGHGYEHAEDGLI